MNRLVKAAVGILITISFFSFGCKVEELQTGKPDNTRVAEFPKKYPNANDSVNNAPKTNPDKYATPSQPANAGQQNNSNVLPDYGNFPQAQNSQIIAVSKLIIPVANVKKEELADTFTTARSEGRVHNALDIMAAEGTPVLAATDGKIVKFHDSERGGITIYQLATDNRLVLYYAHLKSRAENLHEGDDVKKGTLIGYVGDTGNSGTGNFHLHFAMWIINDPKRYWEGTNLNPYQYLQ